MSQPERNTRSDDLVEEIRSIRRAMSEQLDNDVDSLCDQLREIERQYPDRIAERPSRRQEGA